MDQRPSFADAWYAQLRSGADALLAVHDDELRALTAVEALRRSEALLSMTTLSRAPMPDARKRSSGLVEQQALFARSHREK